MATIIKRRQQRRKHPQQFILRMRLAPEDYGTLEAAAADWPSDSYKLREAGSTSDGEYYVDVAYHASGANRTDVRNRMRDSGLTEVTGGTLRTGSWRATSNGSTRMLCSCEHQDDSCDITDVGRRELCRLAADELEASWLELARS